MQNVPISVTVCGSAKLEQLGVVNLDNYVKYTPSLSYVRPGRGQQRPARRFAHLHPQLQGDIGPILGMMPAYGILDLAAGAAIDNFNIELHTVGIKFSQRF